MVRKARVVAWYIWSDSMSVKQLDVDCAGVSWVGMTTVRGFPSHSRRERSTWIETVAAPAKDSTAAKLPQKIYFCFHSPLIGLDWVEHWGRWQRVQLYSKCSRNHCCPAADPDWICPIYSRKRNTIPSMILIWNLTDLDEFKIRQTRPLTSQKALFKCNLFTSKETPISYIAHFLYFFSHDFFFWKLMFHNIRKKYSLIFSSTPSES